MFPDDLRRRLEELSRGPLRARGPREIPAIEPAEREPVSLADALGGAEVAGLRGVCHEVERPLDLILPDADDFGATYRHVLEAGAVSHAVCEALSLPKTPSALVCKDLRRIWSRGRWRGTIAAPSILEGQVWA